MTVGACQACQRPFQRICHGSQRHAQYFGNVPVPETFRPQRQAALILVRHGPYHGQQPLLPLNNFHSLVRPVCPIARDFGKICPMVETLRMPACPRAMFQSQVVRYPEDPARQIRPWLALPQMLKERQKYFLRNFLGIGGWNPKRKQISKNRNAKLFEQRDNLVFHPARALRRGTRAC